MLLLIKKMRLVSSYIPQSTQILEQNEHHWKMHLTYFGALSVNLTYSHWDPSRWVSSWGGPAPYECLSCIFLLSFSCLGSHRFLR